MSIDTNNTLDVALIGAGVSSLYSGWRLKTAETTKTKKVTIFEMSDRVGGRLHSVKNFGMTGMSAELGGMRYLTHQKMINDMIEHFDLDDIDFPMGDADQNLYYLRRTKFKAADWGKFTASPPYNVSAYGRDENGKLLDADQIFSKIVKEVLDANLAILAREGVSNPPKDRAEWDKVKPKLICHRGADKGHRLEDIGFWNLVQELADSECYDIVAQAGAYYSNTINWNAAEALPYVTEDFTGETKYKTLKEGFDGIARKLHQVFLDAGGTMAMEHRLLGFEIQEGETHRYKLTFLYDDEEITYFAHQIVFGMPRRSLELIQWPDKFADDLTFRKQIRSVIGDPSFKLLMAFDHPEHEEPWWEREFGLQSGRSVTDLPMRQCYYFGTNNKKSILLATYNDMRTVSFWKTLEDPNKRLLEFSTLNRRKSRSVEEAENEQFTPDWDAIREDIKSSLKNAERPKSRGIMSTIENLIQEILESLESVEQAPKRMVDHALSQLRELHQYDVPEPYYTAFANWNDDPYGGGYHAWKARYSIGEVMEYMRKPLKDELVHVVGEAYSDQQGWVEGAFCIAELMLEENFGLNRPDWLTAGYYLGR